MGAYVAQKRGQSSARVREEASALVVILTAVALPALLACILIAADMRTDLSDLMPSSKRIEENSTLIGWPELEDSKGEPVSLEGARWHAQPRVKLLGYMMAQNKAPSDCTAVTTFLLMPEAGHFLYPAPRFPTHMVEVSATQPIAFQSRQLVWAAGVLTRTSAAPDAGEPSYALADATVVPALESDVMSWFKR